MKLSLLFALLISLFLSTPIFSQDIGAGVTYYKDSFTLFNISILRNNDNGTHVGTTLSIGSFQTDAVITSSSESIVFNSDHYGVGLKLVYGFSYFYLSGGPLLNLVSSSGRTGTSIKNSLLFEGGLSIKPLASLPFAIGLNFLFDDETAAGFNLTAIF